MSRATLPRLTHAQEEVLLLIGDGLTAGEIARTLGVSESAVRHMVARLRAKFGASGMRALIPCARHYLYRATRG